MEKKKSIFTGVLGFAVLIGVLAAIVVSVMTYREMKSMRQDYHKMSMEMETSSTEMLAKREDGVKIAEEYTVESTLPVSEAFKSGDSSKLTDADKETLDMAKKVLKETVKDSMSAYEKEKAIYEWMVKNIENGSGMLTVIPTTSQENACPHGVLKNHNAVCVGYATTFRLFMQMLGIPCKVVHNKEMIHTWDLVKLENDWYHVDVYTDAGGTMYTSFNVNDAVRGNDGGENWDREIYPKAEGLKYNIAYQNKKSCSNVYEIPKLIRDAMKEKSHAFMIDFGRELSESDQLLAVALINGVDSVLNAAEQTKDSVLMGGNSWMQDPKTNNYLCKVILSYTADGTAEPKLSKKEIKKIIKEINKSFSDIGEPDPSIISGGDGDI